MPRLSGFVCASLIALSSRAAFAQEAPCPEDKPDCHAPEQAPIDPGQVAGEPIVEQANEDPGIVLPVKKDKPSTGTFSVGAGFSTEENFIASTQVAQNNLFGTGYQLSFDAALSAKRQALMLKFTAPHVGDKDGTLSLEAGISQRIYPNGLTQEWNGGRLSWRRALDDNWTLTLAGTVGESEASAPNELFPKRLLGGGVSTMGSIGLAYQAQDDPQNPRNEFKQAIRVDLSKNIERDDGFFRIEKNMYYAFSLKKNTNLYQGPTLRFGLELGYMSALSEEGVVPVTDRFFAGGEGSVRGFSSGTLGPQLKVLEGPGGASSTTSIGGLGKAVFRSELTFPILKKAGVHGLVFFDAGNTFGGISGKDSGLFLSPEKDFGVLPLRTSAGVGIKWESPIGPLNFTWGVPLDRRPGEAPVVFQFSIGRN